MLKAFLLSAGLGTRLKPLTNELPKCLLPIDGKPLLQIWLEHLSQHGIQEVLINTHWHHEKVGDFLKQIKGFRPQLNKLRISRGKNLGIKELEEGKEKREKSKERELNKDWPLIHLFYEPELLGSAGTLLAKASWVADGEPFFILYGDNLTNVNLTKMLAFHRRHGFPFTLGVFRAANPMQCGIAEVDEGGMVTNFVEKPKRPKSDLAAAGIYVADRSLFRFFPVDTVYGVSKPLDLGFHVIPRLVGNMKAYPIEDFLMDIGTPESYRHAQEHWRER